MSDIAIRVENLTGRANIYLNGAILGMMKKAETRPELGEGLTPSLTRLRRSRARQARS